MGEAQDIRLAVQPRSYFGALWAASGVSNLADGIGLTAAPLLAATLTRDPLLVSGLTIAQRLPWFLFTLVSGALVDRLDRRLVMQRANLWRFLLLGILAVAVVTGRASLLVLYLIFFLLGCIETLFDNAALAILPHIVEEQDLEDANGRLFATATLANELIGPPLSAHPGTV
jgi:MFS family permease